MAYDYEIAAKGMINAINNMAALKTQHLKEENSLLIEAVKAKRELQMKQAEKNMMSPLEQQQFDTQALFRKQYDAEQNPSMPVSAPITGLPQPTATPEPVMSLLQGGQGDINAQPIQEPTPQPQPMPMNEPPIQTMRLTPKGIEPMGLKDIVENIALKQAQGQAISKKESDLVEKWRDLQQSKSMASAISSVDINMIPRPQNDDERAQILGALPSDVAENVQAAGEYRLDATKVYGLRNSSGDRAKFDALINRIYPDWDMKKYQQRQRYLNNLADTSSTKLGGQVIALNTLPKHLETFIETIEALKNQGLKPRNAIVNYAKNTLGYPEVTDFKMAKEIVYGEMQKVVNSAAVTQEGMNRVDAMLNENASYDQMINNARLLIRIAEGRIIPLREQYKNVMGKEENGELLYPESREVFNRYSKNPVKYNYTNSVSNTTPINEADELQAQDFIRKALGQ